MESPMTKDIDKAAPRTLYIRRDVLNAKEIISWAKEQGFKTTLPADDLHVTVCYSRAKVDWMKMGEAWSQNVDGSIEVKSGSVRIVEALGDKGAVVLMFASNDLSWRHEDLKQRGATWDHQEYQPHITITYEPGDVDLAEVEPYRGKIKLGPEVFEEVNEDWSSNIKEKFQIVKLHEEQRMVYGWASVISEKGVPFVDSQDDIIEAHELLKATTEFMQDARVAKAMHKGSQVGEVIHSFPLVAELAKTFGIECEKEGWIVGVKIKSDEVWNQVKNGTFKAFSIGAEAERVKA